MREHMGLFRGKRTDTGDWVEGNLVNYNPHFEWVHIAYFAEDDGGFLTRFEAEVIPDTIGECTGLRDKNGKLIFERDIFRMDDECIAVIIFKDGSFRFQTWGLCGTYTESGYDECGGGWGIVECEYLDWYYVHDMQIAGNIHDNPELLKGGEGA